MTPTLRIHLLGEFRLWVDGQPLDTLNQPRQQALLAYLLLHRHAPQPRQQIAFHFWPDSSERQAFANLRRLVFDVRQALPHADRFLTADSLHLGWRNEAAFTLDVAEVGHALDLLEQTAARDVRMVERVVALYTGELLPTCYDDWLLPLRRSLHERVVNALTQALVGLAVQHEYTVGLRTAAHLVRLDPLHEAAYRHLMHLRALSGDRAGALRVYHECVTMLEQELGVPPVTETQALYRQLLKAEPRSEGSCTPAPVSALRHEHIPLVGRKHEWQVLYQAWQRVQRDGPHMVTVWGEAGVGKTRLVEELLRWAGLRSGTVAYARSYAAEGALSYAPVTEWLRSDVYHQPVRALEETWRTELARLLPELLSEQPELPPPTAITEGWQRQRFYEALPRAVLAGPQPVLLVLDDLQWCDGETLAWLRYLLRFDRQASLLVVGTVRSEAVDAHHPLHDLRQPLQREAQWTEVELAPLSAQETTVLAGHLTDEDVTPWEARLYQETEGNPLFVVEMVQAGLLVSRGSTQGDARGTARTEALPEKVQSVITARLSQLSPLAHQLAQVAATIGRAFAVEVLAAASELDEDALVQGIDELWQRRIVREQREGYDFSHDKIREVAYSQVAPMRRRHLHRRVSLAIERHAEDPDTVAGELAEHAEQAGQIEQAIHHLRRAAEVAQRVGAYPETVLRLRKAIALLRSLSVEQESAMRQELALLIPLGACLVALRGYGDSEVEAAYTRAHQLCTDLGDDPNFMPTLVGLALFYLIRGELQQALLIGQQSLALARRVQDDGLLLEAHLVVGPVLQYLGRFRESVTHLEQGLALYDPARHSAHAAVYGHEPGVAYRVILAISLWFLGYADRSLRLMQEGLALAHKMDHPYTLNLAQTYNAQLYHLRHEPVEEQRAASAGLELARQQGFQYWQVICTMFQGWAETHLSGADSHSAGQTEEVLLHMQEAFAGFEQTGARLLAAYYVAVIAEAQVAADAVAAGSATLDKALARADVAEDGFYRPELHRLRGEFLLRQLGAAQTAAETEVEAETAFKQAMRIAQAQEARTLELRAATSLARLWLRQGRRREARDLLAGMVGWFTEGFDTPDLREATALLDQLPSAEGPN